jgi:hypothetical protein
MAIQPLPHATRNQVFTALYNLLLTTPPPVGQKWNYTSQSLELWDQVKEANQPSLFLHRSVQIATENHAYGVTKWLWKSSVWVYYRVENYNTKNTYPDQLTDQFLDGLEQVFLPVPPYKNQTLGGLCVNAWIDGQCIFDSGLQDGQAVIVIPISIYV